MSNRNTHFDANFNEDAVFEAEFKGAVNVEIKEILYNTKEYWDSHPELVSANGILYIYSDYKTVDNIVYAGIKVGDDSTLLIDLPFTDEYILDELHQSISSIIAQLNTKADKSTTYTKTEVDSALSSKADKSTTYTKTEVDNALRNKADYSDMVGRFAEVDLKLYSKADKLSTYTKDEVNNALDLKSDKSNTYTKAEVDNIISNLPDPMIFKGSVGINGTITDLPVASASNDGFTYKVITEGTYQGIDAKVGDVFTSNGAEWVLIPSGDDVEDTWREIKVNGITVLNSALSTGAVDFVEGDNIEVIFNSTGNTILIKTKNIYTKTEVNNALDLKSNKSDTYTKTEVNNALSLKADKSDTYTKTEVDNVLSTKADINGTYEDMTVGTAMKLVATRHTTDTAPYLFRQSGGDNNAYVGTEETDKLVGASAVVNNAFDFTENSDKWKSNGTVTKTWNNGVLTISNGNTNSAYAYQELNEIAGHKVFYHCDAKSILGEGVTSKCALSFYVAGATTNITRYIEETRTVAEGIFASQTTMTNKTQLRPNNTANSFEVYSCYCIDLTAMFGTTIADYVYSLEQATAGSGIAYLRKYGFFTKDYYPYTANTLQSVNTSKHTMVGVNQWDEEWEYGYINLSTGEYTADGIDTWIRSKNKIRIKPNTSLFWACRKSVTTGNFGIIYYDKDGQYMSGNVQRVNRVWVTPDNCAYVAFFIPTLWYGKPYTNDVSINYPSTDTEYHAYSKHEYALPNIDLRGLYKLDASNNLYADGDTLEGDDTLTRKYEQRPYQSGDESLTDAITDGTNTVVKLATPTTEQVTGFTNPQIVSKDGTEEYVDDRDFPLPVGHETDYPLDSEMPLPVPPIAQGTYNLQLTVDASGNQTYSWAT